MLRPNSVGVKVERARVLITDATPMAAQLLADALRRSGRFAGVSLASRSIDVTAMLANQPFDVLLISSNLEGEAAGATLAREACRLQVRLKVVMLLEKPTRDSVVEAFRAGCKGVFCHARSVKELTKCLVCVHRGQIWASSRELKFLLEALRERRPLRAVNADGSALLTKRETAVVRCVADGLTNKEIANELGLSTHTVKNHLFRIFDKLGVSSRIELIHYAMSRSGLASRVA